MYIVKYNKPRPRIFVRIAEKGTYEGRLMLQPGVNSLTDDQHDAYCTHPAWKRDVALGDIEVVAKAKSESVDKSKDLLAMDVALARQVVGETYQEDLLKSWLEEETRPIVKVKLESQLELVSAGLTEDSHVGD